MRFKISMFVFLLVTHEALGSVCSDVATDTLEELRAGVSDTLDAELEELIRTAAGSACVKALSGRYGEPLREPKAKVEESSVIPVAVAEQAPLTEDSQQADSEGTEEGWSFGGLKFRSLSGSPGSKPYERQRKDGESGKEQLLDERENL